MRPSRRSLSAALRLAPSSTFDRRLVVLGPGSEHVYDECEWRDAIVLVERGAVDLVCSAGLRRRFARGDVLWLSPLPLRALRNAGSEPVVLLAVSRRRVRPGGSRDESARSPLSLVPHVKSPTSKEVPPMNGGFVWFDLRAKEPEAAQGFYEQLLGWSVQKEEGGPTMIAGENGPWASVLPHERAESAWVPYLQVADADEAAGKAVELGATMVQEATEGPAGRSALVLDPGGAPIALFEPRR